MAKLTVKKKEGTNGLHIRDYDILVDDCKITLMTGITFEMDMETIPNAVISFLVDDLEADADFVALVKAQILKKASE